MAQFSVSSKPDTHITHAGGPPWRLRCVMQMGSQCKLEVLASDRVEEERAIKVREASFLISQHPRVIFVSKLVL